MRLTSITKVRLSIAIIGVITMLAAPAGASESSVHLVQDDAGRFRPVILESGGLDLLADIDSITAPAVSPDGSNVAFSGSIGDESLGRYAIFVVGTDGSGLTQLTSGSLGEFDPSWSPDGRYIVFSQNTSGSLSASSCCRIGLVNVQTGAIASVTGFTGGQRPEFSPDGTKIVFDNPTGVWEVPARGGTARLIARGGFDATYSPESTRILYVRRSGNHQLRVVSATGDMLLYSDARALESPKWIEDRIWFIDHLGIGYDSRSSVRLRSISGPGSGGVIEHVFDTPAVGVGLARDNDEIFFYRESGSFRYYDITPEAGLIPIRVGDGYSPNWDIVTALDIDGDHDEEMLFYRTIGSFKYYHVAPNAGLVPIRTGAGYGNWDSIIGVDLDGDGRDEVFFYNASGEFMYREIRSDATLGTTTRAGSNYSPNWDSITAVDLDGDGKDEMFFYRKTGSFRYYDVTPSGGLVPIRVGTNYSPNWDSITAVDLD